MKIIIQTMYKGKFDLSDEAKNWLRENHPGKDDGEWRTNSAVIKCIEVLGEKANPPNSYLQIMDVPDDLKYTIDSYSGVEVIREYHRFWDEDGEGFGIG